MAVIINLTDGNGSKTEHFKQEKIPATQGNVINTLNAYNDKIKKEYYDKKQARADENALQKSIQNIVKLLAKSAWNDTVTIPENTKSEDTDNDRLEKYLGSFDEDNDKKFDEAGLVQKINVIANILSGNTDSSKQWDANVHGNNVGKDESTLNVPIIGITREDGTYTATFEGDGNITFTGLNDRYITRTNGKESTIKASEITVLSEKQVSLMIAAALKTTFGGFNSQIANIVSYLLFQEGDLPNSYKFVLNHTNDKGIKSAPLYVTYEDNNSNIGGHTGPAYYIHDLNGNIKETPDYVINASNIGQLISDNGYTPSGSNFTLKADGKLENIRVYYKDKSKEVYTLSVPKKTLTLNLHGNAPTDGQISYSYSVLGKVIEGAGKFEFNEDGIAYENFPQGSTVTITKPSSFNDTLFCEENYTEGADTDISSVDLSKEDAHVYNKKIIFNFEDDTSRNIIKYYSSNVSLSESLSKVGYTATLEKVFSVSIVGNVLDISKDTIWEKVSANTDEFTFDCDIIWVNRTVDVTFNWNDHGLRTEQKSLITGQEISPKDIEGYDFKGWKRGTDNTKFYATVPFEDIETLTLTADQTLKEYNCIYDLNGGSWNTNVKPLYTHQHVFTPDYNTKILTSVSRPGYNFVGWYKRPELEDVSYKVEHFQNEDCTYYAKWEEKNYTINFELDNSKQLEDGANPMFKYQRLTVKASNLPITLGQAYATGYDFVGWAKTESLSSSAIDANNSDSYAKVTSLEIRDFTADTINLSAVWKAKEVPVIEEYYYEIDGQRGKYDLLGTSKKVATVGTNYSKDTDYSPNTGFVEKGTSETFKVMPTGNVYKRYFNRGTFTVTYKGIAETDIERTYTYSDNAQELASIKDLTDTDNSLFDCWLEVKDGNKTPIKHISAYRFEDINVEARYNQNAPVLYKDFEVNTTTDTITITNNNADSKTLIVMYGNETTGVAGGGTKSFSYSSVYKDGVITTQSCFVYFSGIETTNTNASESVEVPLIYNSSKPVEGDDYSLESATSTVIKREDGLEYRIGDSTNYLELTGDLPIARNKTIYIRKKATFSRFASADVSASFSEKADAVETALVDNSNFKVVDVSYKEQGHIEINNAVFEGNHGALQYKTGSGNAWLDVNRTESANNSTTLYVDKPCTVSFRYNESDEYRASSTTLNLTVGIKTHTVTFDVSNIPSKNYKFDGLTSADGEEKLTLLADSGSQLCKVKNYIENVNNWTVTGYNMDIDTKLGRAVSFLKLKNDDNSCTPFNEASIIDRDITLLMSWKPIQFINKNYTDVVLLENTKVNLPQSLLADYTGTFDYGKDVTINLVNDLTKLVDDEETLKKILNVLDGQNDKLLSLSELHYKSGGSDYENTGVEVTSTPETHTFKYFDGPINFGADSEVFPKFASKFTFVDATGEDAVIQFVNDQDSGEAVGKVKSVSYYGGNESENFRYNLGDNSTLHVYHVSDLRASGYSQLAEFTATENTPGDGNGRTLTVIFHSAYINGTFYPHKEKPGIIAIKQTITNQDSIYSIKVGDNGSTVIDPKEGWAITTTDVSAYQANGN